MIVEESSHINQLKRLFSEQDDVQTDEMQQRITDFLPAIVYVYDTNSRKLRYINKQVTDVLGYSFEDIRNWDNDVLQMVFKDDLQLVKQQLESCFEMSDDDKCAYQARFNHKEGSCKYFKTMGTVLRRDENGRASSVLFVAEDVTGQVQSMDEIRNARELLNDTEELLQFGTWQWDMATDKISWSDGMYRIMGYSRQEAPVLSDEFYLSHVHPSDAEEFRHIRSNAIATKTPFEYTYRITTHHKQQRIINIKMKFVLDQDGQVAKGVAINRDVTEKTQMLHDLMHYKRIVVQKEEFLNVGNWELELTTNKMTWSDGMFQLLGYNAQDKKPEIDLFEFYRLHLLPEEIKKANDALQQVMDTGETYVQQTSLITKDGSVKTVEVFGKILKDQQGQPVKILGTVRDVTRLKEYEQELEIKVDELNRSNHELEEFAYVASHDLQEPLRKLTTFGERLKNKCADQLSEEGVLYLTRMMASAENMRILIDNLLEFSRVTRSHNPFEKNDLNMIVKEVLNEQYVDVEDGKAEIQVGELPIIDMVSSQMKQLFNNLLSNALKFRRPGIIPKISIRSEKLTPSEKDKLKLRNSNLYFRITVIDNGIGFEEAYAERIFQLFQRLHGKAEYPGSGMGLAICRKITDNHKGLIMANSVPGQGSRFTIILPETQSV
jgi:PAS domain S-box-containing protein